MEAKDADVKEENEVKVVASSSETKQPTLEQLKLQQKQLQDWTKVVNARIFELETSYIEEASSGGNLIKGWELENKYKKPNFDEKERLFSFSSYRYLLERKANSESFLQHERTHTSKANAQKQQQKKQKKRKAEFDDWNALGDY